MENELETVQRLIDSLLEFSVAYGFQFLGALVFLLIGLKLAGWCAGKVRQVCERREFDVTFSRFIANVVRIVVVVFVIIITLGNFGISIAPLIALAGAAAFGATLAMQGLLSNYGAGLSIILARPFVVGNTIAVKGVSGVVEEVSLATTVLRGEDGEKITVPNKEIVGQILINSDANRIVESTLYIGAASDPLRVVEIVREILDARQDAETAPPALVGIHDFALGGVALGLRYWVPSSQYFQSRYAVNGAIQKALDDAGIPLLPVPWPASLAGASGQ